MGAQSASNGILFDNIDHSVELPEEQYHPHFLVRGEWFNCLAPPERHDPVYDTRWFNSADFSRLFFEEREEYVERPGLDSDFDEAVADIRSRVDRFEELVLKLAPSAQKAQIDFFSAARALPAGDGALERASFCARDGRGSIDPFLNGSFETQQRIELRLLLSAFCAQLSAQGRVSERLAWRDSSERASRKMAEPFSQSTRDDRSSGDRC